MVLNSPTITEAKPLLNESLDASARGLGQIGKLGGGLLEIACAVRYNCRAVAGWSGDNTPTNSQPARSRHQTVDDCHVALLRTMVR
jgi:hypothetical protein